MPYGYERHNAERAKEDQVKLLFSELERPNITLKLSDTTPAIINRKKRRVTDILEKYRKVFGFPWALPTTPSASLANGRAYIGHT